MEPEIQKEIDWRSYIIKYRYCKVRKVPHPASAARDLIIVFTMTFREVHL